MLPKSKIKKAVIPAAGFGTRMFPATKAVKKEFLPIVDSEGRAKPVILAIVEEILGAGIEEVAIIVQKSDRKLFEDFFKTPPAYFQKLSPENQEYSQYIQELGTRIDLLTQEVQDGYGHAVFCAREWIGNEPFLLSLGDHLYASDTETSCTRQLLDIYEQSGQSAIGLGVTPVADISHRGCVAGIWQEPNSILSITQLYEKPDSEYAKQYLHVSGMPEDMLLYVFGLYALAPKIFDYLEDNIRHNRRERGEFQLTSCLDRLREEEGMLGYLVKGRCFDIGRPDVYWQTAINFRNA
ncbi:MAG: UTP--glucose-1-phosphate uridylyltransferase [Oscillatoria sp. SIO1A7]|nr:UTP--glucose-1-phosphate uridylyltransferase [Oscillatoria sp. SIO1A7]